MKLIRWTIILCLIVIGVDVRAGVLIEPYFGYDIGQSAETFFVYDNNENVFASTEGSGYSYGGRLGYSGGSGFLAFDYSLSSFEIEDRLAETNGTPRTETSNKSDVDQTAMGIAVGFKFPALFRVWGKYLFRVHWDIPQDKMLTDNNFSSELIGYGVAVGIAYTPFAYLNIFAEYQSITVDRIKKITLDGDDKAPITQLFKRKRKSILVGISAPFG